jgi:hypothetical protein
VGVKRSSCGNGVYGMVNSTQCPLLPPPPPLPPPNMAEQWDLNGSWVVLSPPPTNQNESGSTTFTVLVETVNAERAQRVRIQVAQQQQQHQQQQQDEKGVGVVGRRLDVFLTCLAASCAGFPSKLHSREEPATISASGEVLLTLQPAAVYTLTTRETAAAVELPISPPKRSLFSAHQQHHSSEPSGGDEPGTSGDSWTTGPSLQAANVLFESAFAQQQPQEPGFGLANFYGNFEVSTEGTLRQTSVQPPWAWSPGRPDGQPVSIFGANLQNYAVSVRVRMTAGGGSARVCGRVGETTALSLFSNRSSCLSRACLGKASCCFLARYKILQIA